MTLWWKLHPYKRRRNLSQAEKRTSAPIVAFGGIPFRNYNCRRPSLILDDGKTILVQTLLRLLSGVSLAVYHENRWHQLPVMALHAATFHIVVRFSVENSLNRGCHVPEN